MANDRLVICGIGKEVGERESVPGSFIGCIVAAGVEDRMRPANLFKMQNNLTNFDNLTPAEIKEINTFLAELSVASYDCVGIIVVKYKNDKPVGYWNGGRDVPFMENHIPYPYTYISIKAAQKQARKLGEGWELAWWWQPDYYGEHRGIEKYIKMTGGQFFGSPRH